MDINDILDQIEELLDAIEDLDKLEEFMDRIDELRDGNCQNPDPMEMADLLSDILEFVIGKLPLGPYAKLIEAILEFIRKTIDSNVRLALFILWGMYKRWRENFPGWAHEQAAEMVTSDALVSAWLRLKWLELKAGGEDDEVDEDENDHTPTGGGISIPVGPAWSIEYNTCCTTEDNGIIRGKIDPTITIDAPSWGAQVPSSGTARLFSVTFKAKHPCGLKRLGVRVFVKSGGSPWLRLENRTRNFRFRTDENGVTSVRVIGGQQVRMIITATSNCETQKRETQDYIAP